jgi:hypothetical protein
LRGIEKKEFIESYGFESVENDLGFKVLPLKTPFEVKQVFCLLF